VTSATCDLCGSTAIGNRLEGAVDYVSGERFNVRRCSGCGLAWTEPHTSSLDAYYPARYRKYRGFTSWALRRLYDWRIRGWSTQMPGPGRALEVGCGDGWMLAALRDRGWRVFGNEREISSARAASQSHRIPMFVGDLDALSPSAGLDLVVLFQSLEHVPKPLETLQNCAHLLRKGGSLVVSVPNFDSWQARLSGRSWLHLDVPRHQHHFSPPALQYALEKVGLRVVRTRFVSPEHDPYGWVQSGLNLLGFRQNLLLKLLMGYPRGDVSMLELVPMFAVGGLLAVPAVAVSVCSWMAGSGAIMEMWATKS
jgi:SAM-dependent methyltransferase